MQDVVIQYIEDLVVRATEVGQLRGVRFLFCFVFHLLDFGFSVFVAVSITISFVFYLS